MPHICTGALRVPSDGPDMPLQAMGLELETVAGFLRLPFREGILRAGGCIHVLPFA